MRKAVNSYLARQEALRVDYLNTGERIARQLMADSAVVVLNEQFGFGYDRILKFLKAMEGEYDRNHAGLDGGSEADVAQEHLDNAIRRIMAGRGEFCPFRERYPEIREIKYLGRGGKGG